VARGLCSEITGKASVRGPGVLVITLKQGKKKTRTGRAPCSDGCRDKKGQPREEEKFR